MHAVKEEARLGWVPAPARCLPSWHGLPVNSWPSAALLWLASRPLARAACENCWLLDRGLGSRDMAGRIMGMATAYIGKYGAGG